MPILQDVVQAIRRHDLLAPGDRVLVAVSGGADSTALAALLADASSEGLPLALVLAHVDHGWRGATEARDDRAVLERLTRRLDVPLDVSPPPPATTPRTEAAARRWRYGCLDAAARRHGCTHVATGHHLRDQAETVLLRLLRGSGRVGLRGIPRQRTLGEGDLQVVRPLLDLDPRRLRAWLETEGLPWREDPTNADLSRDRARIRARLLALEARGGSASQHLAALATRLTRRLAAEEARLAERLDAHVTAWPEAEALGVARRVLEELDAPALDLALRRLGRALGAEREGPFFTRRHLHLVAALLRQGGALDLPRGLAFQVSGRTAWLRRRAPSADLLLVQRRGPRPPRDAWRTDPRTAQVDARRLGRGARLRPVEPTDTFVPWGRGPGHRVPVLAWLKKRQVPAWLRARTLVVVGDHGIAWVVGHRIDQAHALTHDVVEAAFLAVEQAPPRTLDEAAVPQTPFG